MHILSEIHFWSTREDIAIKHREFGALKYFTKKDGDNLFYNSKKNYFEERGVIWNSSNKQLFKLRDKIKELEELLVQNKIVCSLWINNTILFLLSRGLLVNVTLNPRNSVVTSITFNKSLVTKLQTELISEGVLYQDRIAVVSTDGRIICQGGIWGDGWVIEGSGKRRVSLQGEYLCIWGRVNAEHPQPWSPISKDVQKSNLLLYWVGARGPELCAHKKTEGEPINVIISKVQNKTLVTVEQKVSLRGAVCVEVNTLELIVNNLNRVAVTSVPLQTQVSCSTLSDNENQLILGCIDGSVALLDRNRGSTRIVKTSIIPTLVTWHKSGAVAAIANERGQLQYFDNALNCINTQLFGEESTSVALLDLSAYFNIQPNVSSIKWGPKDLIVMLEHGPIILITHLEGSLSFTSLAQQYLKVGKIAKAIALLLSWQWNDQCFNILQQIVAYLLKLPLTEENAKNLQDALSSFHNSPIPLSASIKHKYGSQVRALTRRFFHQLVRYKMFETAFLLAVDIGHHDLFMDLYYCATKIGEREMAAAARAQASALLSSCSSEASCCSRSLCSQCSDSYSSSSTESSPLENNHEISLSSSTGLPAVHSINEDFLTTNFNDANPKTYQAEHFNNYNPPAVQNIDLPKAVLSQKPYFKPPQFPPSLPLPVVIKPPPLPIAPPLPITTPLMNRNINLELGIPTSFNNTPILSDIRPRPPPTNQFWNNYNFTPPILPSTHPQSTEILYNVQNAIALTSRLTPGLPTPLPTVPYIPPPMPNSSAGKKQQAKVKFSDTVTAFIVPEVKRPVRPPPPPHITDPQKELADSLPLCHPNEDYLKDFTPARRNEPEEPPAQSKIKVVHFGVV